MKVFSQFNQLTRKYWLGIGLITLYNLLSGANEVYIANIVQKIDPFFLVFLYFLITIIFFNILQLRFFKDYVCQIKSDYKDVVLLNILTLLIWSSFFVSLKYIEPAVVATIDSALGPVIMLVLARYLRPQSKVLFTEIISSVGIFISLVVLTFFSLTGRSAIGSTFLNEKIWIGIFAAFVCGIAIVVNSLVSKRLHDRGWTAHSVMSVRFFLLVLCAFIISHDRLSILSLKDFVVVLLIVFCGTIIPLYLLQVGIKLSEPITLSLLLSTGPIFTLLLQIFDPRLNNSVYTSISIFAVIFLVVISILSRHRSLQ